VPAISAQPWRLTQLGGDRKELILSGLDAPWGRPRQKPVVSDSVEVREDTIYYAGSDKPTRHIFGLMYETWELQGRIGDRNPVSSSPSIMPPGTGYAKTLVDYMKRFVADQLPVTIQWGNILSATGFVRKFTPKREAEYEVEYVMQIRIDSDESTPKAVGNRTLTRRPVDVVQQAIAALQGSVSKVTNNLSPSDPNASYNSVVRPGLLEGLENAVATVNSAIANVLAVTQSIDSIDKATIGDLKRLRAGIGQMKTAAMNLQNTFESTQLDLATQRRSFISDWSIQSGRADSDLALLTSLGALEALNKQAEIAERGRAYTSYVAKYGDSWELISTNLLGGPDRADSIRQANGVTAGTMPVPGRSYKIPFPS
jgi:hypothetical protein